MRLSNTAAALALPATLCAWTGLVMAPIPAARIAAFAALSGAAFWAALAWIAAGGRFRLPESTAAAARAAKRRALRNRLMGRA